MRRLVTNRRLDEGLWTSADLFERGVMMVGVVVLVYTLWFFWMSEAQYFATTQEIERGRAKVIELPCAGSGMERPSIASSNSPVHLTACPVSGLQTFTQDSLASLGPDLEFLRGFRDNLPEKGIEGAYFRVHMKQAAGRRRVEFKSLEDGETQAEFHSNHWKIDNLNEVTVYSPSARIGGYQTTEPILKHLPGAVVPLRQSPQFHQEVSIFSSVQSPYSSKNMIVRHNKLYTSTSDPDSPLSGDVMLWFTVADARDVSMLSLQGSPGHLTPWSVPGFKGTHLSRAELGSVSAHQMLGHDQESADATLSSWRIGGMLFCWVGTLWFVFPRHSLGCFNDRSRGASCGGFLRAFPVSLPITLSAIATAWAFQRSALLTMGLTLALLAFCLRLASDRSQSYQSQSDPEAESQAAMSAIYEEGSRVRILESGLQGTIISVNRSDRSDMVPYKVEFDSGAGADWYGQAQLELLQESETPPEIEAGETSDLGDVHVQQSAPLQQVLPEIAAETSQSPLTESLLPPVTVDVSPQHSDPSHAVRMYLRMMALGMAVGLGVAVVAMIFLAFASD